MAKLKATVSIGGTVYAAGDEPPSDVADLITNPDAWEDEPAPADQPPRAGKGSGVEVWRAHAEKVGVTVPDDATRDDIIAAVDAKA